MDNQHQKITGYRDLSAAEIDAMNAVKAVGAQCGEMIEQLQASKDATYDQRWVSIAKTDLQKGIMAAVRAIAQPNSF